MKMPVTWGIDVSGADITPAIAQQIKDSGVEVVVQCLWDGKQQPVHRVTNLRNLSFVSGLKLGGYISPAADGRTGGYHANMGISGVPDDLWAELVQVAVDFEIEGVSLDTIVSCGEVIASHGKPRLIYTNYNSWVNFLGNPAHPLAYKLWNAFWDADPDSDFDRYPFGAWSSQEVIGEQFAGDDVQFGIELDRNVFSKEDWGLAVTPPPQPVPAVISLAEPSGLVRMFTENL